MVDCTPGSSSQSTTPQSTTSEVPISTTQIPTSTTQVATTTSTSAAPTTPDIEFLPNGCPVDIHIHYLLPHEYDCAKYYQCTHGTKVEMPCGEGTWFDFNLQVIYLTGLRT